jgi:hypothetical protein
VRVPNFLTNDLRASRVDDLANHGMHHFGDMQLSIAPHDRNHHFQRSDSVFEVSEE